MKKLLTIIAALVIVAGVVEARNVKPLSAPRPSMKSIRAKRQAKAAPTETAVKAYRLVLQRRVEACKLALEQAEAKLLAFEVEAAEREGL